MNQEDDYSISIDSNSQRLEHLNKTRAKRTNIRRPTLKRLQLSLEEETANTTNEDFQPIENEIKKLKIVDTLEPVKQPTINSNVLETIKLRRISNQDNQRISKPTKNFRYSMCENIVNTQETTNPITIDKTNQKPFMRIKTNKTLAFSRPLTILAEDDNKNNNATKETFLPIKLRPKIQLQNDTKNNEAISKRFSMLTTSSNHISSDSLTESFDDRPRSVKDRIKQFEK